jgi:uncharacterized membrane protein
MTFQDENQLDCKSLRESMLRITAGENDACATIVLSPNNSAGWKGNQRFFKSVAVVSLFVSAGSLANGAPLVLFFTGLELLALYCALRVVSKHCTRKEVIELTPFEVVVQTGFRHPDLQWRWQRLYTRVEIKNHYERILVSLVCRDQKVKIGDFLTDKERGQLVARLRGLVTSYQQLYL